MKNFTKKLFVFFAFLFCLQNTNAQFTSGRLVVVKTSGSAAKAGSQITLQEYQTNGTSGTSVVLPNSGLNPIQLSSGSGATEGFLTKSPDGKYVILAGYSTSTSPITDITTTSPGTTPRIIFSIDASGNYSEVGSSTSFYPSGSEVRGAVTDGTNYWMSGNTSSTTNGITYFGPGTKVAFGTGSTPIKSYSLQIFNSQLYYSTQKSGPSNTSSQLGIFALGSGLPTSGTPSPTQIISTGTAKPGDFSFSPDGKTCYVAMPVNSSVGGIRKYTNSTAWATSGWTLAYTIGSGASNIGVLGMTVDYSGLKPVIYATTYEDNATGNRLIKVTDNGTLATASISTIVSSSANTWLHGISFVPCDAPSSISVSNDGAVCEGATVNLTSSASGSANFTYSWTGPNGFTSSSQNPSISNATPAASGTYNLTISNACGSTSGSTAVTVNANPTTYNVTGGGGICIGDVGVNIGLSGSQSGVTYQLKDGGSDVGSPVSGTGSALTVGNTAVESSYSVLATVNSSGCSLTMNGTAAVTNSSNVAPTNIDIHGAAGVDFCPGDDINLTADVDQGSALSYSWTGPNGFTSTGQIASVYSATTLANGTYNITVSNSCGSVSNSINISVNSSPTVYTVTGGGSYCQDGAGVAVGLSNSTVGVNYQLKADGSDSGSPIAGTGSAISFGNKTAAATYTVVAYNASTFCNSTMTGNAIVTITSNVTPTVTISSNVGDSICIGTNVTLTAIITNGGSTPSYQWKYEGANIGTNKNTYSRSSITNGKSVSCVVTSNATCVTSATANSNVVTFEVTSKATPTVSIASDGGTSVCNGQSVTFTATPTSGGSSPSYQWKLNGSDIATGSTYNTSSLSNSDVVTCALTSNYGCVTTTAASSNSLNMTVTNNVTPALTISSDLGTTICQGSTVNFTTSPTNGGGSPTYQWKKNGSNIATGASYSTSDLANNDQISCELTPSLQCLTQPTATSNQIDFTVNPTSSSDTTATACGLFNWYGTVYSTGGDKTRTLVSSNGCDSIITLHLTINTLPTAYNVTGGGSYCENGAGVAVGLSNSTVGVTYQLKDGGTDIGSPISGSGAAISFGNITDEATYTVVATNNSTSCATNMTGNAVVTVSPNVTPSVTISSNVGDSICIGTNVTVTANVTNGGTTPSYQWKYDGANVGTNRNTYGRSSITNGKTITCVITSNATCQTTSTATSNAITFEVTSKVTPTLTIATTGGNSICDGTSKNFTTSGTHLGDSPVYDWKVNGSSVDETGSTFSTSSLVDADEVSCSVISNYGCLNTTTANSNAIAITVVENITPSLTVTSNKGAEFCNGVATFTATPTSLGNLSYEWKLNGSNVGNTTDTYERETSTDGDIVSCTVTTDYECVTSDNASDELTLTIWEATTGDTTATACETFDWYGETYTSSGVYTHPLQTVHGCDSIVSLNLTINQPSESDTTATACQTFTWYDNTYTTSGDYNRVIPNAFGCDSTITLHLTINDTTYSITTASATNSYYWNNRTYYASGFYRANFALLLNSVGCDSTAYLNLTLDFQTKIKDAQCNTTVASFGTPVLANSLPGGTQAYMFKVQRGAFEQEIERTTNYFSMSMITGVKNGQTYNVSVKVKRGDVWYNYSDVCAVSTPPYPTTQVKTTQCNTTIAALNTAIGVDLVGGVTGYRVKVVDGLSTQTVDKATNSFNLWDLSTKPLYDKTYSVSVALIYADTVTGYGSACNITTPASLQVGLCNSQVPLMTTLIKSTVFSGAQAYRIKFVNGAHSDSVEGTSYHTSFSKFSNIDSRTYGTTYDVSVKVKFNDVWNEYSASCPVTAQAMPLGISTATCNIGSFTSTSKITANTVTGATKYKFMLFNGATAVDSTIVTSASIVASAWKKFTRVANETYGVKVAVEYKGTYTSLSDVCLLTFLVPAPFAKEISNPAARFATIYPNPFVESIQFHEDESDAVYSVNVLDITGKLVDSFEGNIVQLNAKNIGSTYISGVYTLQLTKQEETKIYRVIKE